MKILVCGPESSGTKVTAYILQKCGAEITHRSYPHAFEWPGDAVVADHDAMVFVSRDMYATVMSQLENDHVRSVETAVSNIRTAHLRATDQAFRLNKPIYYVTIESLQNPRAIEGLCLMLGLEYN